MTSTQYVRNVIMSVFGKIVLLVRNRSNPQSLFFLSYFYAVQGNSG